MRTRKRLRSRGKRVGGGNQRIKDYLAWQREKKQADLEFEREKLARVIRQEPTVPKA